MQNNTFTNIQRKPRFGNLFFILKLLENYISFALLSLYFPSGASCLVVSVTATFNGGGRAAIPHISAEGHMVRKSHIQILVVKCLVLL